MSRKELEKAVLNKCLTDMEISIYYTEKEIKQEIKKADIATLINYLQD